MSKLLPLNKEQQQAIAKALRAARPPVVPNTNVIIDPTARAVWYDAVTKVADVACRGQGMDQDRRNAAKFFDTCGVPN